MTLVELLVAMVLGVLVIGIGAGLFASAAKSQNTVSNRSSATTTGQLTMRSLVEGIENSSEFSVFTSGSDLMVVARTAGTASTLSWQCIAWYYQSSGGGTIRTETTADGTKITVPTASQLSSWTMLATGITPVGATPVFQATGSTLTVGFIASVAGGNQSVTMQTTILGQTGVGATGTCF